MLFMLKGVCKINKYDIYLSDDVVKGIPIENFDANELSEELNNLDKEMIAIGTGNEAVIVQRLSVIKVIPNRP